MNAYKMLILLLVMLLDSSCVIEANESSTEVDDSNDDGSVFEDDNDSGNSFFTRFNVLDIIELRLLYQFHYIYTLMLF